MVPCGSDGKFTFVDGFCGSGGVTEGFIEDENIEVIAAINHSPDAIYCYKTNNPQVRCFEEDFTDMDEKLLPKKVNIFWISAECTFHSNAAGGTSRDADSRSQPEHIERYVVWSNPDYVYVENVKEILNWGPVIKKRDENGKLVMKKRNGKMRPVYIPDPKKKKTLYNKWVKSICALGYNYEYRILNSADFGAHTSRERYFGIFAKKGLAISWPESTHSKNPDKTGKDAWRPCKETIDLEAEGTSIFGRAFNQSLPKHLQRPLVPATLKRLAMGINKFFLSDFIAKSYSNGSQISSLEYPLHAITTTNHHSLVQVKKNDSFIQKSYSQGSQWSSIQEPLHTITTVDRHAIVSLIKKQQFITQNIQKSVNANSIDKPMPTILTRDEKVLVTLDKTQFLDKDNGGELNVQSINEPLHTIVTADSKKLITIETNEDYIDSVREKEKYEFFLTYFEKTIAEILCEAIKDIKMRYLFSVELARTTGFRDDMYLGKSETQRKYHIGNAVPPAVASALSKSLTRYNKSV